MKASHSPLTVNNNQIQVEMNHKHLGLNLDEKLTFAGHIREAIVKAKRGIGIIRFFAKYASRYVPDQMYKPYVRPHLDYGDIIYHDQNMLLSRKLESIQYETTLPVSGGWKGTNTDRVLEELGWETRE